MKITALIPWFGSKRTLAPIIHAELGRHAAYYDPTCGSMAVLLSKPVASHEIVNDLHGDLINLAMVIRDTAAGSLLYRRLRRTLMHEDLWVESRDVCRYTLIGPMPDVDRAYHYFVWSWCGRNWLSGTHDCNNTSVARRWTHGGDHGGKRFHSAVGSIPQWQARLRHVTILRMDCFDMIARIDDCEGSAVYCDPPYIEKGAAYVHDFSASDHERLAESLQRFRKARVVVSYYDHPRLAELYPESWTRRRIDVPKCIAHQGRRAKSDCRAPELLLLNGPSFCEADTPCLFEDVGV